MSPVEDKPLAARLAEHSPVLDSRNVAWAPIDDHSVFRLIAAEIARMVTGSGGTDAAVVVDSHTASRVDMLEEARNAARRVYLYGTVPVNWGRPENVVAVPFSREIRDTDRLIVIVSSKMAYAAIGSLTELGDSGVDSFAGAWTAHRPTVLELLAALPACDLNEEYDAAPVEAHDHVSAAMRLTALQANILASRQRDITMDKDDLFSVLNILKAMSAKRSAHDILYVFVEHIARVVTSDRCSIVRIWGADQDGHVLASHEDANLTNHNIELAKYPELGHVLRTGEKIIVNDVRKDALMKTCLPDLERANIRSLLVIPIVLFDRNVGSLLLRAARNKGTFTLREISFFEIVAEAASNALERAELFERIQKANERLEHLAITDGLTGLFNHRCFRTRLEEEVERALRYRIPLSCMIFDVDNFKQLNDAYGHLQGDNILCEIGKRTLRTVRRSDIVARYGGEEFVVIMPQTASEGAFTQGQRLCEDIGGRPFDSERGPIPVTVSIGVGVFDHDKNMDCEGLIVAADKALYEAKRAGKNQVILG